MHNSIAGLIEKVFKENLRGHSEPTHSPNNRLQHRLDSSSWSYKCTSFLFTSRDHCAL